MSKIALLIGAGFSKWAVNLPLANELFDYQIEKPYKTDSKKLEHLRKLKSEWDLENPQGHVEQFIADALTYGKKNKELVLWYISRRLSDPFIWNEYHAQRWRRHVMMVDEKRKFLIPGFEKANEFLQQICGPFLKGYYPQISGIVTTNYDLLIEYILGTKGLNYGIPNERLQGRGPYPVSQWNNPIKLVGEIPVAKIHGSISWDHHGKYTDGRRGLTGKALIIAPTPEKLRPDLLLDVWQLAEQILLQTTHLIVFGFGFNPYDEAVLNLLSSNANQIREVLLIDIQPNVDIASSTWTRARITPANPPPRDTHIIDKWLKTLS